jgi:hypothetical protein
VDAAMAPRSLDAHDTNGEDPTARPHSALRSGATRAPE